MGNRGTRGVAGDGGEEGILMSSRQMQNTDVVDDKRRYWVTSDKTQNAGNVGNGKGTMEE